MATFKLEVSMRGAALAEEDGPYELARLMHQVAAEVEAGATAGYMRDYNGNSVGNYWTEEDA